jgi:ArsR family transcriptional regulator, arsenate/arsenite/antimonite-responsive transcriptional repressor
MEPAVRERGVWVAVEPGLSPKRARDAAGLLRVLADPTRLGMLATLRRVRRPVCICDFVASYDLGQPTISHHMGKLRAAGLVTSRKVGVWAYYEAASPLPPLVEALLDAV